MSEHVVVVSGEPLRCGYCGEKSTEMRSFNRLATPDICPACYEAACSEVVAPVAALTSQEIIAALQRQLTESHDAIRRLADNVASSEAALATVLQKQERVKRHIEGFDYQGQWQQLCQALMVGLPEDAANDVARIVDAAYEMFRDAGVCTPTPSGTDT